MQIYVNKENYLNHRQIYRGLDAIYYVQSNKISYSNWHEMNTMHMNRMDIRDNHAFFKIVIPNLLKTHKSLLK
jgi:hypothetical protein